MKRILSAFMVLFVMASCACADVEISAANFPDNIFRAYVRSNFDGDNDGILTDEDIRNIEGIDVSGQGISSLKGIEFFTDIIGINCSDNNLTGTLDVSTLSKLQHLHCNNNSLTGTLDLSRNTALLNLSFENNKIEQLNITGCMVLENLNCKENQLKGTLDLSGRTALTGVWCRNNKLEQIIVTGCTALQELSCNYNNLTALDVSNLAALQEINCNYNNLTALDVSSLAALKNLYCSHNNIEVLNVSNNRNLEELNCNNNELSEINVSQNKKLKYFDCTGEKIYNLDVTNNTALETLRCPHAKLTEIDISRNTALVQFWCYGNYLTTIDLSHNVNLKSLRCMANSLTTINLSHNPSLEELRCQTNRLTTLDLSRNTSLNNEALIIERQIIRNLDVRFDADDEMYPYQVDLNSYLSSDKFSNVITSSIKGFDSEGSEIPMQYSNGTVKFTSSPVNVRYDYNTGYKDRVIHVNITSVTTVPDYTTVNNHVYRAFHNPQKWLSWQEAQEYCHSIGGYLAVLSNKDEYDAVHDMLAEIHTVRPISEDNAGFWIGCEKVNGKWQWTTGEELKWTITFDNGDGLTAQVTEDLASWPRTDYEKNNYICEWDSVSVDSAPLSEQFTLYSADPEAYYEGLEFYGAIPEPSDLSHLTSNPPVNGSINASAALPSRYDLRDYGHITGIKNQDPYGTCWAFASIGAIESNYLVQNPGGTAPDLSELHLAWFAFRDLRQGYSFPLNDSDKHILNQGGFHSMPVAMFSRMSGPALESDLPYSRASNVNTLTSGRLPESYTRPFKLKDAYTIGRITQSNRDTVKNIVINHGAVMISYLHSSNGVQGSSYYNPSEKTNHAVEIIGWDDNYSRSNFRNQPSSNGAWLIRNSWGEYGDENGCFWMSYEQNIGNATAYIIEDTIEGLRHYGHDELGSTSSVNYQWSANIFKAQDNEKIIEVGFYTKDNNVPYTIYINKLGSELPVNPGTLSSPVLSGTMANAGYHALSLTNPIELEKGEYFSVILRSGKSSEYDYVSAIESRLRGSMVNEGESYFASSNTPVSSDWTDGKRISTGPFNACVKAFTVPSGTEIVKPSITSSRLPDGKTGERYSYTLTASGTNPITWSVSGLPEGLSLSNSTITGTPSKSGSFSVYVSAKNTAGSDTRTLSLTITSGNGGGGGSSGGGGGGCSSFSGIHVLLALSLYAFMKKR